MSRNDQFVASALRAAERLDKYTGSNCNPTLVGNTSTDAKKMYIPMKNVDGVDIQTLMKASSGTAGSFALRQNGDGGSFMVTYEEDLIRRSRKSQGGIMQTVVGCLKILIVLGLILFILFSITGTDIDLIEYVTNLMGSEIPVAREL